MQTKEHKPKMVIFTLHINWVDFYKCEHCSVENQDVNSEFVAIFVLGNVYEINRRARSTENMPKNIKMWRETKFEAGKKKNNYENNVEDA